ncbi:MAG: hypothetical protein WC989_08325 [Micavibrio sp.]
MLFAKAAMLVFPPLLNKGRIAPPFRLEDVSFKSGDFGGQWDAGFAGRKHGCGACGRGLIGQAGHYRECTRPGL